MKKKYSSSIIITTILLCSVSTLLSYSNPSNQIIAISIPKCGTYLLSKCITLMTGRKGIRNGPDDIQYNRKYISDGCHFTTTAKDFFYLTHLPTNLFWFPHLIPMPRYKEVLAHSPHIALFFIYRDPRDQTVSLFHHIRRKRAEDNAIWKSSIDSMSDEELMTALITSCKLHATDDDTHTHILNRDVNTRYRTYMPWIDVPGVCAIRFEDLVGSQGGGSEEAQYETLKHIAQHMKICLNEQDIKNLSRALFGHSATFHKGQIGAWKNEFTPTQKELFKTIAGQLLIDLGYEKDFNW